MLSLARPPVLSCRACSITTIDDYFGLHGQEGCSVLFDNDWGNKKYADAVGAGFVHVRLKHPTPRRVQDLDEPT